MKSPPHVLFRKDLALLIWQPRAILDETTVNEVIAFIETVEKRSSLPINRFCNMAALDAVDLNFNFVFHVALGRRLAVKDRPVVKSAYYVTSRATHHYAKLHAVLTDFSPLDVRLFTDRAAAAEWLCVPLEALSE